MSATSVAELNRQIDALRRARRFVHYGKSFALAQRLRSLVAAIEEGVLPTDPDTALDQAGRFVRADSRVFAHVDDSAGVVADVFGDACQLWLKAAAASLGGDSKADRVAVLHALAADDDYGVRERLLRHANDFLSEHELRRLAARYEQEVGQASGPDARGFVSEIRLGACARLGLVAEALRDAALYERSVHLYRRAALNPLQLTSVGRRFLEYGHPGEAAKRLEQARSMGGRVDWGLLARCYDQLGETERQIDCLWNNFEQNCSFHALEALEAVLPPEEHEALRERALGVARREPYVPSAVTCLLQLERAAEAESLMLERFPGMGSRDAHYTHLLGAANLASEQGTRLTATLCYRRLLLDILEEARSRAYGHAARYLAHLDKLAARIRDYRTAPTHEAFLDLLRQQHGRKRAFWRRVGERRS